MSLIGKIKCPPGSRRTSKRLGQGPGSGTGKTAGKGHKGQRARSGAKRGRRTGFEGGQMPLYRRLPKIRFSNHKFKKTYQLVNIGLIDARALEGDIGPEELKTAGLIRNSSLTVKILGNGSLTRSVTIRAHKFSQSAQEAIEQAGGKAEVI